MYRLNYLYVEDDRLSRQVMSMIMKDMLQVHNYTVFEDSTEFMQRLKSLPQKPDVIFMDIHMDPLDGFEMLTLVRADPAYSRCRVIALTASVMNEEVMQLRAAGFDGTIGKPINAPDFPGILNKIELGESVWQIY